MLVIAIETELSALANCAETNVMTRSGFQIVTENEIFFVSRERYLNKYKDNLYRVPGTRDRLLTFAEAAALRETVLRLEDVRQIRVKGTHRRECFNQDGAHYALDLSSSDVEIKAKDIRCVFDGRNSHVCVETEDSVVEATAWESTFDIRADRTAAVLCVSDCFVELSGDGLEVMIIGNNNTVSGIADGIHVFCRGKRNEFVKRTGLPEEDPSKAMA
jgi:hypothetical protein